VVPWAKTTKTVSGRHRFVFAWLMEGGIGITPDTEAKLGKWLLCLRPDQRRPIELGHLMQRSVTPSTRYSPLALDRRATALIDRGVDSSPLN
jgi:hypothetical protein